MMVSASVSPLKVNIDAVVGFSLTSCPKYIAAISAAKPITDISPIRPGRR
jgi:hypothetical protein